MQKLQIVRFCSVIRIPIMQKRKFAKREGFDPRDADKLNDRVEELYDEVLNDTHLSIHHKAYMVEIMRSICDALLKGTYLEARNYLSELSAFAERPIQSDVPNQKLAQRVWRLGRYISKIGDGSYSEPIAG